MAVASTRTLLPLDRFFRIAGVHPLHANQVVVQDIAPANFCGVPILQFGYQDADRTGREEIAQTIADVETRLMEYLSFSLRPDFQSNVSVLYPVPHNPDIFSVSSLDARSALRSLWLGQGYLISGGQEAKTSIGNFAVVYTDTDSDGYKETATITAAGFDAAAVASEVAVYYPGESGDDAWEVRPLTSVTLVAGTATIVCRREQLVKPELMFGLSVEGVDGTVDASFLATVDVYRHWLDPSAQQVEFRWDNVPCSDGSGAVQYSVQSGAMLATDAKLGWAALEAASWDIDAQQYVYNGYNVCRMPDAVRLWFKAGWPLDRWGNMDGIWERCVTYLTLAMLDRPICECASLQAFTQGWALDLAVNTTQNTRQVSRKFLECPFGTTKAAQYAWDAVRRYQIPDSDGAQ